MSRRGSNQRSERIAYHEAAHAVVALHLGAKVYDVVLYDKLERGDLGLTEVVVLKDPFLMGLIYLAGDCSDHEWFGTPKNDYSEVDYAYIRGLGFTHKSIQTIYEHTLVLIRKLEKKIDKAARALMVKDQTGASLKKICNIKPLRLK